MVQLHDSVIMEQLLVHIGEQRVRAKLINEPFELGIATDKKPSQILAVLREDKNQALLKEIGMAGYKWHDDALRSELSLAGESLLISVCRPR